VYEVFFFCFGFQLQNFHFLVPRQIQFCPAPVSPISLRRRLFQKIHLQVDLNVHNYFHTLEVIFFGLRSKVSSGLFEAFNICRWVSNSFKDSSKTVMQNSVLIPYIFLEDLLRSVSHGIKNASYAFIILQYKH
jgi:hypothetical protein